MRLASFKIGSNSTWGLIEGDDALDIGSVVKDRYPDLKSAIAADALAAVADAARDAKRYPTAAIHWLPVIPNPDKILCIGLNYETHRKETGRSEVENPPCSAASPTARLDISPTSSGRSCRPISTMRASSRSSSANPAATSPGQTRGAISPATPATMKAACATSSVTRISSRPARIFRRPARSGRG